ncbi:MAG: HAD-IA family hydrolase [Chroococcidiopsidaceae cyanobacterium CP_BM_RX_35]|nr:HAD-IA family hydrolase [Chroococcidiopsidaceae cyanobacterium CP_BM_RX_35]
MIDFNKYEVLTFDCYGTLIDWESSMLAVLKLLLANHGIKLVDEQILELFAEFETEQEKGKYIKYREVIKGVVQKFGERFGFEPSSTELDSLADTVKNWLPFPDTVEALKFLKARFKLAIISNVDDALFASTAKKLEVEFDWVITAEQAESYKPSLCHLLQWQSAIVTVTLTKVASRALWL